MENTNFQPIFDYIDEKIGSEISELRVEMATKKDVAKILDAIDAFAKESKDDKRETIVVKAKSERIEHWVMKAAEKIEVPYKP